MQLSRVQPSVVCPGLGPVYEASILARPPEPRGHALVYQPPVLRDAFRSGCVERDRHDGRRGEPKLHAGQVGANVEALAQFMEAAPPLEEVLVCA